MQLGTPTHTKTRRTPTRRRILDAALPLFVQHGFVGTPVPAIAEAAGIAAGTIYRSFPSKEALVNELYRETKHALMAALLDDLDLAQPPRMTFRHIWFQLGRFAREQPDALAFLELHHHGAYLDAESMALEQRSLAPFYAFFQTDVARDAFKPLAPTVLMAITLGSFFGLFKAHRLGHLELTDVVVANAEAAAWDAVRRNP